MSTTVDSRVVEMRFDNKHFESNVSTTMSTLDKLKQKLSFKDHEKSFDGISKAAKNVNLEPVGKAADTVGLRFSAMYTMADQALRNITNSAMHAGKQIINALTLDPIKTGFQEYETQINAVQTILANTSHKGTTIDQVNAALDELNTYADKTIYNFTEMTRNIGTFTAAGLDLNTSVSAIQGLSNLAAMSGASAEQNSRAMYQLSQALSTGVIRLTDWNSMANANMGGDRIKETIMETARAHGVAVDDMIKANGNFNLSLQEGWLTSEIMAESLEKFTMSTEGLTEAQIEQNREMWRSRGYTEEQIDGIFELGNTATDAATKVKTFSQMWDVIKESIQSGWAKTWQIIFGDFEEAKALFTPLTEFFTGIIGKMSDARNKLLDSALGKNFVALGEKIKGLMGPINGTMDSMKGAVNAIKDYEEIVNKIIRGDFGNGVSRWNKLTEAGYDWAHAQNLVNERLGDSTRHATDYKEAQEEMAAAGTEVTEVDAKRIAELARLSDAELKQMGYTQEQIAAFRELAREADKLGIPIDKFIMQIDELNGRSILLNSFKNIGQGLVSVFTSIGKAYREIFPPMQAEQLYNIIAGFHKLSTNFVMSEETANNLTRTFKGLFAALDIILTVVGGPIKIAFKAFTQLLGMFDMNILDVTAMIGDAIVGFRDWIDSMLDFTKIFEKLMPYITKAGNAIKTFGSNMKESIIAMAPGVLSGLKKIASSLKSWAGSLKNSFMGVAPDIIAGLKNGLSNGISGVVSILKDLGLKLINAIKGVLGIHSPSTVFIAIGGFIIAGLLLGLQNGFDGVKEFFTNLGQSCADLIKNIDFGKVFSVAVAAGLAFFTNKLYNLAMRFADVAEMFAAPAEGLGEALSGVGNWLDSIAKVNKAKSWEIKSEALKNLAISIGLLVASMWLISKLSWPDIGKAAAVIVGLGAALVGLTAVLSILSKMQTNPIDTAKIIGTLLGIGVAMLLMSKVIKTLGNLDTEALVKGGIAITALGGIIVGLIAATKLAGAGTKLGLDNIGGTILKVGAAMLLMAWTARIIGGMDPEKLFIGVTVLTYFAGMVTGLIAATKLAGSGIDKAGGTIFKVAAAMLLLALVARIIGGMNPEKLILGMIALTYFAGIVTGLIAATKLAGGQLERVGATLLAVSGSMMILAMVARMLGDMKMSDLIKGVVAVTALAGIMVGLLAATRLAKGGELERVAVTMLAVSIAIGILAAVSVVLSSISVGGLAKGIIAVGMLSSMMVAMMKASWYAKDCKSELIVLAVAVGLMGAIIAALSFIDAKDLVAPTLAMSALMGMFALMTKVAGQAQGSMKSLIVLTAAVAVLGGVLWGLSMLPIEDTLASAASLSMLMIAMSAALQLLSNLNTTITGALKAAISLTTMIVPLLAFVGVLWLMQHVEGAAENATALAKLAGVLAVALGIIALVGFAAVSLVPGLVALGVLIAELAAIVGVLWLMQHVDNATENVNFLIDLLNTLTDMLRELSTIGPLALIGVVALAGLTLLMVAIGDLAIKVGALFTAFPALEQFIDTGIPILEKLANGIGRIISAFVTGMASGLPEIGTFLSEFMTNAQGFIDGMSQVDEGVNRGVNILAGAILKLVGADILAAISSFFQGGSSFSSLGTELSNFIINAMPFIMGSRLLDASAMEGVKNLATAVLILTASDFLDGLNMFGNTSLANFGKELGEFGPCLKTFSDSVAGINPETIKPAAEAAKLLAEMAEKLPNTGGMLAGIVGDNDMKTFGTQLAAFGTSLVAFSNSAKGIDVKAIKGAAEGGKAVADMAADIPNFGGIISTFTGDNDLDTFGTQLVAFGTSLVAFSGSAKGIELDAIKDAAAGGKALSDMATDIPNFGGMVSWFTGDNDLDTFGTQLKAFGTALSEFSGSVTGIKVDAIKNAAKAGKALSDMAKKVPNFDTIFNIFGTNDLTMFGKQIKAFGKALGEFYDSVDDVESEPMTAAIKAAKALGGMIEEGPSLKEIIKYFSGDYDFNEFGNQLSDFGDAITDFAGSVEGVEYSPIKASVKAAKALAGLKDDIPDFGGLISYFSGDNDFDTFGEQIKSFGGALFDYSNMVRGIEHEPIDASVKAGKSLADLAKEVPSFGGLISYFSGDNDFVTFGHQINSFAASLVTYSYIVSRGKLDSDAIAASVAAGKSLADLMDVMPKVKGVVSYFKGETDVVDFGSNINSFAASIVTYSYIVSGKIDANAIAASVEGGKALAELMDVIPKVKGVISYFKGEPDIVGFGSNILAFATSIRGYSTVLGDGIKKEPILASVEAGKALAGLMEVIPTIKKLNSSFSGVTSYDGLTNFGMCATSFAEAVPTESVPGMSAFTSFMGDFGTAIVEYSNTISGIDPGKVLDSATAGEALVEVLNKIPGQIEAFGGAFGTSMPTTKVSNRTQDVLAFKTQVSDFAFAIKGISDELGESINLQSIQDAATAGGLLRDLFGTIQSTMAGLTGGVSDLTGFGATNLNKTDASKTASSITGYINQLVPFADAISKVSSTLGESINLQSIQDAAKAGEALRSLFSMTQATMKGLTGTVDDFGSFSTFGAKKPNGDTTETMGAITDYINQLEPFATAISKVSTTLGENFDITSIENAAKAGESLRSLFGTVQATMNGLTGTVTDFSNFGAFGTTGGLVLPEIDSDKSTASDNITNFCTRIKDYAKAIAEVSNAVSGIDNGGNPINLEAIQNAVTAGTALSDLAKSLPKVGGDASGLFGENMDMTAFGEHIKSFGKAMSDYSTSVTDLQVEPIANSVTAAQSLSDLASALPSGGGLSGLFGGDNGLKGFANNIKSLGEGLSDYSDEVSNLGVQGIAASVSAGKKLLSFINSLASINDTGVSTFTDAIDTLGDTSVQKFIDAFSGATSTLTTAGGNLLSAVISGIQSKQPQLTATTTSIITTMINTWRDKQNTFAEVGTKIMAQFVKGIQSQKAKATGTVKDISTSILDILRAYYSDYESAGSYVVSGFAAGIRNNEYKAINAAISMAKAALTSVKSTLGVASPAKELIKVGKYIDLGLEKGLIRYSYLSNNAARDVALGLIIAMNDALGIHSPAKEGEEVGKNTVDGVAKGIEKDKSAEKAGKEKATKEIKEVAKVVRDASGKYIVQGIAAGITEDMSAEEAAEKKAQNISEAFSKELEKVDVGKETLELEYDKWAKTAGSTASKATKAAKKLENVNNKYSKQLERTSIAEGEYLVALETFGEGTKETQEAYNKYLKEQIALLDAAEEITVAQTEAADAVYQSMKVVRDDSGRYIMESVADYIRDDTSAEEAAAAKGKVIAEAFEAGFKSIDLVDNIRKTYDQIAALLSGKPLDEVSEAQADYDSKKDKYAREYAKYVAALNDPDMDKNTDAFRELEYNAQNAYLELLNSIDVLLANQAMEAEMNTQLFKDYLDYIYENKDLLLQQNMTMAEIEKLAQDVTGYDPELSKWNKEDARNKLLEGVDIIAYDKYGREKLKGLEGVIDFIEAELQPLYGRAREMWEETTNIFDATPLLGSQESWARKIVAESKAPFDVVRKYFESIDAPEDYMDAVMMKRMQNNFNSLFERLNDGGPYDLDMKVRPVLSLSDPEYGPRLLAYQRDMGLTSNINSTWEMDFSGNINEITARLQDAYAAENAKTVAAIEEVQTEVANLKGAINGMEVKMDGNAVVGTIATRMDTCLGTKAMLKGRGN